MKFKDIIVNIRDFLSKNIIILCLVAYSARLIIFGSSWGESFGLFALAGLYGYLKYLSRYDTIVSDQVTKTIQQLKNDVASLKLGRQHKGINEQGSNKRRMF
jgi:hypothetical protein